MVFGNSGENSGTGVAFTRNPVTGENHLFESTYLMLKVKMLLQAFVP